MIRFCLALCSTLVLVSGCSSDDKGNGSLDGGDSLASYAVTFTSTWSVSTHPVDYPANPHFSALVGATHDSSIAFWADGELATPGIQDMAERGRTSPLSEEVDTAVIDGVARFKLLGDGIGLSPGSVSLEFTVSTAHPLVTLVSMIAPSPDWFVGVAGLPLHDGDEWIDSVTVDLYGWDAGTDDGATYAAPNAPSTPHVPIFPLIDGIFEVGDMVPPLGSFTFVRRP